MAQSKVHPTITVNVDEWLQDRQQPRTTTTEVQEMAQDQIEEWHAKNERRARESLLAAELAECSECGKMERSYHNDYICYRCRDELES